MPRVKVLGKGNSYFDLEYLDGVFFAKPPFVPDLQTHLQDIRDLDIRDDDVIISSYPKSGTHWLYEMIHMLRKSEATYDNHAMACSLLNFIPKPELDKLPSPRTLTTHARFRHLPRQIAQKKTKIIRMCRDPRDVAVSYFNHQTTLKTPTSATFDGEFSDYLPLFQHGALSFGSWFDHSADWEKFESDSPHHPTWTVYYEDMMKDPLTTVKDLATFLGLAVSDKMCDDIVSACEFSKMKAVHLEDKTDPFRKAWKDGAVGIYRKGGSGGWKKWFTVAQSEHFDILCDRKLQGTQLFQRYGRGTH